MVRFLKRTLDCSLVLTLLVFVLFSSNNRIKPLNEQFFDEIYFEAYSRSIYVLKKTTAELEFLQGPTGTPDFWFWKQKWHHSWIPFKQVLELERPALDLQMVSEGLNEPGVFGHLKLRVYYRVQQAKKNKLVSPEAHKGRSQKALARFKRNHLFLNVENRLPFVKYYKIWETRNVVVYKTVALAAPNLDKLKHPNPHSGVYFKPGIREALTRYDMYELRNWYDKIVMYRIVTLADRAFQSLSRLLHKNHSVKTLVFRSHYYLDDIRLNDPTLVPYKTNYVIVHKAAMKRQIQTERITNYYKDLLIMNATEDHRFSTRAQLSTYWGNYNATYAYDTSPIPYNILLLQNYHDLKIPLWQYTVRKELVSVSPELYLVLRTRVNSRVWYHNTIVLLILLLVLLQILYYCGLALRKLVNLILKLQKHYLRQIRRGFKNFFY